MEAQASNLPHNLRHETYNIEQLKDDSRDQQQQKQQHSKPLILRSMQGSYKSTGLDNKFAYFRSQRMHNYDCAGWMDFLNIYDISYYELIFWFGKKAKKLPSTNSSVFSHIQMKKERGLASKPVI